MNDHELQHFGVVGMKWGRRMAKITRPGMERTQKIKTARAEVAGKLKAYEEAEAKMKKTNSGKTQTRKGKEAYDEYRKAEREWSDAQHLALSRTSFEKGERVAGAVLGTMGALSIAALVALKNR